MPRYLLTFADDDPEIVEKIDKCVGPIVKMDCSFLALTDVWLLRTEMPLGQIEQALRLHVIPREENNDEERWLLVEIASGTFGGTFSRGVRDRLEKFFGHPGS